MKPEGIEGYTDDPGWAPLNLSSVFPALNKGDASVSNNGTTVVIRANGYVEIWGPASVMLSMHPVKP